MGLGETVRELQKETVSAEILWLRGLRAFVAENSVERLLEELDALLTESESAEKADRQGLYLRTLALIERGHLADFYGRVLQYAEIKQRSKDDSAEKAIRRHWEELQQMEKSLKHRYEKLREGCR